MYPVWEMVTIYLLYVGLEPSGGAMLPCALLAYGLCVIGEIYIQGLLLPRYCQKFFTVTTRVTIRTTICIQPLLLRNQKLWIVMFSDTRRDLLRLLLLLVGFYIYCHYERNQVSEMVRPLHPACNIVMGLFDWLFADAQALGTLFCRLVWDMDNSRDEYGSIMGVVECKVQNHTTKCE